MDLIYFRLKTSQTHLAACVAIHMFILIFWSTNTIVKGFGYYDAVPPASFNAISHTGFWLSIEIFVLFIGAISVYFGIESTQKGIEFGIESTTSQMTFWCILIFIAIGANIVHLIASCLELADCRSTLCTLNNGFLIGMIAVLGTIIVLECIELYKIYEYKKYMKESRFILLGGPKKIN